MGELQHQAEGKLPFIGARAALAAAYREVDHAWRSGRAGAVISSLKGAGVLVSILKFDQFSPFSRMTQII